MSSPPIYRHPLPDRTIRLLNIEPGGPGSPLHCTLHETSLGQTNTHPYYALSYVWGPIQPLVPITCNSQLHHTTPNLHAALLEYRSRDTLTPLWVDALCIDQSNVSERTSQVRMMLEIYSEAACVIIWLGEAHETDAPALSLLKTINAPWATFRDPEGREIPLFEGADQTQHDALVAAQVPPAYFDALAKFLLRPWFGRIWVVQELLSARKVVIWCGADTLDDFPVLEAAARSTSMHNVNTQTQIATVTLGDKTAQGVGRLKLSCAGRLEALRVQKKAGLTDILRLILTTQSFDATDPRDKIFALVGLASDVDASFVDYEKSYDDVVRELSKMFLTGAIELEDARALDIWSCISRHDDQEIERPSWVVDWRKVQDSLYTPLLAGYPSSKPVIQLQPEVQFSSDDEGNETLHVRGTIFDHISHIIPSPPSMLHLLPSPTLISSPSIATASKDWQAAVGDLIRNFSVPEAEQIYPFTGEPIFDAFWRSLCCNRSSMSTHAPPANEAGYLAWRRLLEMQVIRAAAEASYRRSNVLQKRWFGVVATLSVAGLTYRFRKHKLLAVVIPFTLGPVIQYFNKTWNNGLALLLVSLHNLYLQNSAEIQFLQRDFEASHSQWCQGRQFFVSTKGFMGWCPASARVGDAVGLFAGCRIPYVLRGAGESGRWRIVGDAYVHGVMDGEGERYGAVGEEMVRIE